MEKKNTGNALEFDFDTPAEEGGGLVFEREEPQGLVFESSDAAVKATPTEKKTEEKLPEKEKREEKKTPAADGVSETDGEFKLPDVFEVNEKYNVPLRSEERTRIYTTYVPRFTEVSETYRMKNDPRPRPKTEETTERVKADKELPKPAPEPKPSEPTPEPEAEAQEPPRETVVVNIPAPDRSDSLDGESYNIFKFANRDPEDRDRMRTDEENANRRALEELKMRQAERRAREEAERLEREAAAREAARARARIPLSADDYTMPDPEYSSYSDRRAGKDADYDVPHSIPNDADQPKKRKMSEYKRASERDNFKDRFLDSLVSVRIRLIFAVLLSLALLFVENCYLVGIRVEELFGGIASSASALALFDLTAVLCAVLLALPEISGAVKALFSRVVLPEISLIVSLAVVSVYTVIKVTFRYVLAPDFGFIVSLSVVFALVASYLRRKADFENFKFISAEGEKRALEYEETRKYPRTMLALDGAVDGYKSNTAKTFRTSFVSDFFANSAKHAENSKNNIIMLAVSLAVAFIVAVAVYLIADSAAIENATAAFTITALMSVPAFSVLSHKLLYRHAGRDAMGSGCAVIGESAYIDNSCVDVIAFEDTEIFGEDDVNLKRFGFYGNEENMNKCMRLISSLFACVGGPLHTIFAKTLEKRCTPATDPVIEADGISGKVDGKTVSAGNAEYMLRHGIKIPEDNDRAYGIGAESMKTMYGAEGGVVFAKFFIRYSFSEEFTSLLPALRDEKIVPLIYTSDPNISNELLRTLTMGADAVRVMRRTEAGGYSERVYPRLSAVSLTVGDPIGSIKLILLSRKYKRFLGKVRDAELVTMSVSAAIAAGLSLFSVLGYVPTALFGLLGAIPAIALLLVSRRKFNIGKKHKGK